MEIYRVPTTFLCRIDFGIITNGESFQLAADIAVELRKISFLWTYLDGIEGESSILSASRKLMEDPRFLVTDNCVISIIER